MPYSIIKKTYCWGLVRTYRVARFSDVPEQQKGIYRFKCCNEIIHIPTPSRWDKLFHRKIKRYCPLCGYGTVIRY